MAKPTCSNSDNVGSHKEQTNQMMISFLVDQINKFRCCRANSISGKFLGANELAFLSDIAKKDLKFDRKVLQMHTQKESRLENNSRQTNRKSATIFF